MVVVGGGVIGLAIAWRASNAGLNVMVVDENPGRGASWAAAGMLAPVTEVHYGEERVLELGMESLARYPAFVAELSAATGRDVGYRESGTLIVALDNDDHEALGELFRFQQRLGLKTERLSRGEARALEPGLAPGLRAAWYVDGDHHVDNRALTDALKSACLESDVKFVAAKVGAVVTSGDRVTGVRTTDGRELGGENVVLAAGCWSAQIEGIPDEHRPPVRPVKGQLLYLDGVEPALLTHNVRGLDAYVVPRTDTRVVVGATVEEQGFDTRVTAGAVYELLRAGYELIPELAEFELLECVTGLRPGSPDNAPMIGRTGLEGLLVATGHYRNGILLTPITADAIAGLLTTGKVPAVINFASPQRFASREVPA